MENKAICKKVSSMLSLYIDNKVNYQERAFIEDHLSNCEECHKKYIYLKSLIKNLKDSYKQVVELAIKKQKQSTFSIREHEKFLQQISPYVDNELDAKECFEFRKYLIKSKSAQKELKNTYILQKELRKAYDRTKKNLSARVSKAVINTLKNKPERFESTIIKEFFTMKTAKIAILAGLIMFGTYEFKQLNTPLNNQTNRTNQVIIKKHRELPAQTQKPQTKEDFIRF